MTRNSVNMLSGTVLKTLALSGTSTPGGNSSPWPSKRVARMPAAYSVTTVRTKTHANTLTNTSTHSSADTNSNPITNTVANAFTNTCADPS